LNGIDLDFQNLLICLYHIHQKLRKNVLTQILMTSQHVTLLIDKQCGPWWTLPI